MTPGKAPNTMSATSQHAGQTHLTMSGAEVVLRALKDQGVEVIFGYPGGAYSRSTTRCSSRTPSATSWSGTSRRRCTRRGLCPLHRQGGLRARHLRPRRDNAVTGLVDALMDSIPIVCLTGQVPTHLIGNDAFQEPTPPASRGRRRSTTTSSSAADLARVMHEAFRVGAAPAGRPGR
jgi:acetolactate synthase-1/2/3 large subunit